MPEADRQQANRPQANPISENAPSLFKALSKYTDSVITTSNLIFRRDLAKEKADKQQRLKEKWYKHSHSFVALAEDHDRASENAVAIEESSIRKIKQNGEAQANALRNLVTSLVDKPETSFSGSKDDPNVSREIERLNAEVKGIKTAWDDLRYESRKPNRETSLPSDLENRLRDLAADSVPKSIIIEYESKVAQLTFNQSKVQTTLNRIEQHIAQLPEMTGVTNKINELELGYGQARENILQQKNNAESIGGDLTVQNGKLELLNTKITNLENGLVDHKGESIKKDGKFSKDLESLKQDLVESRNKTQMLEGNIASLTNWKSNIEPDISHEKTELQAFAERLEKLETSISTLISREHNAQLTIPTSHADLRALQNGINEQLSKFGKGLEKSFDDQQVKKDALVAEEVEKLERLYNSLKATMDKLSDNVSVMQSQVISSSNTKPPTPPPQADNYWKLEELIRVKAKDIENTVQQFKASLTHASLMQRIEPMEVLVESLQQRFDNLSTEQLAASIIHQMRILYPSHPANIQQDLHQIKSTHPAMQQSLYNVWAELGKFKDHIESNSAGMATFKDNTIGDIEKRFDEFSRQVEERAEGKLSNLFRTFQNSQQVLEQHLLESTLASAEDVKYVRRILTETTDGQEKLRAVCQQLQKDIDTKDKGTKSPNRDIEAKDEIVKNLRHDVEADSETFKSLREKIEIINEAIQSLRESFLSLRTDSTSNSTSLGKEMRAIKSQLQGVEDRFVKELAGTYGQIAVLNQMANISNNTSEANSHEYNFTHEFDEAADDSETLHTQVPPTQSVAILGSLGEANQRKTPTNGFNPKVDDSETSLTRMSTAKSALNFGSSKELNKRKRPMNSQDGLSSSEDDEDGFPRSARTRKPNKRYL